MQNEQQAPEAEKIICISWQTAIMPAHAHKYYHASCYNECKPDAENREKRELPREDIAPYTTCSHCGWYLKF